MNRPIWLDPFVLLLQGAIAFLPPTVAAFWLGTLITRHYGLIHHSAAGLALLITLNILLVAVWIAGLMQAARLQAARQDKWMNK